MLTNDQLALWDRENFFHPSTHLAQHARGETPSRVIAGGDGVHITDRDGRRMLDAFAGLYCVNVGYGRTEIAEAIAKQAHELAYYHSYVGHGTEASITLAKMILDRAPASMSKVYFGQSGSDANETNIKLVWYYNNIRGLPQKKKIISRWRGYHGSGLMTGSLTGLELFHKKFDLPLSQVIHTEAPYYLRRADQGMSEAQFAQDCADKLEALIQAEGPTQSPPSSASRSWAPGASCRRPLAIGMRSRRCSGNTTSCSLPMRSSPVSAVSAPCSAATITASRPISSPSPRA